jgi:hypothetical protein
VPERHLTDLRRTGDRLTELSEKATAAENLIHKSEVVAPQFVEERAADTRPPALTISVEVWTVNCTRWSCRKPI